jgi:RNA polymerase sigma factor (sigma-70 family)
MMDGDAMDQLAALVTRAQAGDLDAYGRLVAATQTMTYGVAYGVLRDTGLAQDAMQEAYLRAFRRLADLKEPAAFAGWLRRTVITVALNMRRARRRTFLQLDDVPDVPVLDETEARWSEGQRLQLAGALLTLPSDERRLCDRRYHGGWSVTRLARDAGVDDAAMRKRLQRIREKLRREIEMTEQRRIQPDDIHADLPARIAELLARPRLSDLPENPVGRVFDELRAVFADFDTVTLPEIVDFETARETVGDDALYIDPLELHRVDERRILRYDLTLPLLLTIRHDGRPLRVWTAGKAYRRGTIDAMHLEAFHQAEILCIDERRHLDPWRFTGRVLEAVDRVLPGRVVKIVPTSYTMCSHAWELAVENDDQWSEVVAWGVFTDRIVRHLGGDPAIHTAMGMGCGLERLAMLRFGIDDVRKVETAQVA